MSQPKPLKCLNNSKEFWDAFKIPQSILANQPPTPEISQTSSASSSSSPSPFPSYLLTKLPTDLLLYLFQEDSFGLGLSHGLDRLSHLALALTCKPLLHFAAGNLKSSQCLPLTVPSLHRHQDRLGLRPGEPPCPALVRLHHILAGFPSPSSSSPPPPAPLSTRATQLQVLSTATARATSSFLLSSLSYLVSKSDQQQLVEEDDLRYCPACCHDRPRSHRFWERRVGRGPRFWTAAAHAAADQAATIAYCIEARMWSGGVLNECPACFLRAVAQLEPWRRIGPWIPRS
ncbi:hypothetical protein PG994_009915 [Apiospora phragmitis]|uniref:F-box domain-containing protein n=1 Tax=Apiospora phragmitis TaxID=2905665 RepID=A0ABR1TQN9_9PEZI